jgi:DNA-binding transcriptional LysR family regulator
VARELARVHIVVVASPAFLAGRRPRRDPRDIAEWPAVGMRSIQHGRLRNRMLRNRAGREVEVESEPRSVFNDPHAITQAANSGSNYRCRSAGLDWARTLVCRD